MKNKIFLSTLILMIISSLTISYAAEQNAVKKEIQPNPYSYHHMMPPPNKDGKIEKPDFAAKRAEFEKRLELTDEQKAKIKANREKDRETMKPVFEQIRAKHEKFREIDADKSLSAEDKEKQKQELKKELKTLKTQADTLRKENMKNFESLLTNKQKKEFAKIKKEQKKEMEKRHKEFEEKLKTGKEAGLPVMPPPPKFEK